MNAPPDVIPWHNGFTEDSPSGNDCLPMRRCRTTLSGVLDQQLATVTALGSLAQGQRQSEPSAHQLTRPIPRHQSATDLRATARLSSKMPSFYLPNPAIVSSISLAEKSALGGSGRSNGSCHQQLQTLGDAGMPHPGGPRGPRVGASLLQEVGYRRRSLLPPPVVAVARGVRPASLEVQSRRPDSMVNLAPRASSPIRQPRGAGDRKGPRRRSGMDFTHDSKSGPMRRVPSWLQLAVAEGAAPDASAERSASQLQVPSSVGTPRASGLCQPRASSRTARRRSGLDYSDTHDSAGGMLRNAASWQHLPDAEGAEPASVQRSALSCAKKVSDGNAAPPPAVRRPVHPEAGKGAPSTTPHGGGQKSGLKALVASLFGSCSKPDVRKADAASEGLDDSDSSSSDSDMQPPQPSDHTLLVTPVIGGASVRPQSSCDVAIHVTVPLETVHLDKVEEQEQEAEDKSWKPSKDIPPVMEAEELSSSHVIGAPAPSSSAHISTSNAAHVQNLCGGPSRLRISQLASNTEEGPAADAPPAAAKEGPAAVAPLEAIAPKSAEAVSNALAASSANSAEVEVASETPTLAAQPDVAQEASVVASELPVEAAPPAAEGLLSTMRCLTFSRPSRPALKPALPGAAGAPFAPPADPLAIKALPESEVEKGVALLMTKSVPDAVHSVLAGVDGWTFDAFRLEEASGGRPLSTLAFALLKRTGIVDCLQLDEARLARFLVCIEDGYNDNPYHGRSEPCGVRVE